MKLAKLTLGLLAVAISIAALNPASGLAAARAAIGRDPHASESGPPAGDPNTGSFRWHLANPRPCVRDTAVLVVAGFDATACDSFIEAFARDPSHVVYHTEVRDSVACPAVLPRIRPIRLVLGLFPAGPQKIEIEWVIDHRTPGGATRTEVRHASIDFVVSAECVPHDGVPFVDHVQIGSPNGRIPPCVPPGDSIPVIVTGRFPNRCFHLVGIEVVPDMTMGPLPQSPGVRVTVEDCACCEVVCIEEPVRWSAAIKLPPLRAFEYKLPLEVVRTSCGAPVARFAAGFPFVVAANCGPRLGCAWPSFDPLEAPHDCDARIAAGEPARLTLFLRSSVPLSGLQGEFDLVGNPGLHITSLAAAGPAQGMLLRWAPTLNGARFALVADQGAPIPPAPAGEPAPAVLAIEVEQRAEASPSPVTLLRVVHFIAVGVEGREVLCPELVVRPPVVARICSGTPGLCDFNGDGREDIRDLVLMMRCLRDGNLCGDSPARLDCNQDQVFTIDDVICCSERILGQECTRCPPGETRDARDVKIAFGPPVGRIRSIDLPVRIEGTGDIGGVRLALGFPAGRYDVSGVDFGGAAASWLHVSQVSDGRVLVGLIDPEAAGSGSRAVVTLRLTLKPGGEAGGEVTLESADFTAHDGVKLAAQVPALRQPLVITTRLGLSENRPNPFAGATRFEVTLDRAGPVDIAIFDLGGRRLATVHRGDLPAGAREFTWNGRLADGSRARDGVYFYRVTSGTETLARKLVLLRSP